MASSRLGELAPVSIGHPAPRWQRILERSECASIAELAAAEKIDRSYLCRVLRLTLLAPKIAEAILDERQPEEVSLPALMKGLPVEWDRQANEFRIVPAAPKNTL